MQFLSFAAFNMKHFRRTISIPSFWPPSKNPKTELKRVFRFIVDEPSGRLNSTCARTRARASARSSRLPRFIRRQTIDVTWMPWSVSKMLNNCPHGAPPPAKPKLSEQDDLRLQAMLKSDVEALRAYLKDRFRNGGPMHKSEPGRVLAMCGISGIFDLQSTEAVDRALLVRMTDTIAGQTEQAIIMMAMDWVTAGSPS